MAIEFLIPFNFKLILIHKFLVLNADDGAEWVWISAFFIVSLKLTHFPLIVIAKVFAVEWDEGCKDRADDVEFMLKLLGIELKGAISDSAVV